MYDLLEKCREKLNSTFSYIISIFGDGLKKRVIYHLLNFKPEMTINVGGISLGINSNTPSELIRKTLEALNYAK